MILTQRIELLNFVANQPEVICECAPQYQAVEMSKFFSNPKNIMLGDDSGVLLFGWVAEGLYEMHYLFTHARRGRRALLAAKTALRTMFTVYGAEKIIGSTPRDNQPARAMNRALGGRPIGTSTDASGRPCICYMLERSQWATLSAS